MPRVSKLSLPPLDWGKESIGQRVARVPKERRFTQVELAGKIGIVQTLVTGYETDRLRLTAEMAVRFAMALDVLSMSCCTQRFEDCASPAAKCSGVSKGSKTCRPRSKPRCCLQSTRSLKAARRA